MGVMGKGRRGRSWSRLCRMAWAVPLRRISAACQRQTTSTRERCLKRAPDDDLDVEAIDLNQIARRRNVIAFRFAGGRGTGQALGRPPAPGRACAAGQSA